MTSCRLVVGHIGNWEAAQKVARGYLSEDELHQFYSKRARSCEANRQWQDAEKAYVAGGQQLTHRMPCYTAETSGPEAVS